MVKIEQEQNKENVKQARPINYGELIKNFFRIARYEKKYIKPLADRIISEGLIKYIPELRLELKDLENTLLQLFRQDPKIFLEYFKEGLFDRLQFEPDVKELLDLFEIIPRDLHIIPSPIEIENVIPEITDFSRDLNEYKGIICNFIGRYMNIGLIRSIEFRKMAFQCQLCGEEFNTIPSYRKTRERYQTPNFCMNAKCKARNKSDFRLIEEKSEIFEIRSFSIGDIDINKEVDEKKCIILNNISYFIEHVKGINFNEEVEILGILHIDTADIFSRKEDQEVLYYIEVLDMKPKESKIIDEKIIRKLRSELKKNPDYCNEIIDSIHPYSKYIYDYFPAKLLVSLSFITCDSWDENENTRNSLNGIIGGHKGSLKTRMGRAFQEILGQNMFGIIYGSNTTAKGLIPTAQRNNQEKNLVKRYGALAYYHKKTLLIDESQYLKEDALECLKYIDDGNIARALDGTMINAPAKESIILSLNYKTENEAYDYSKPLIKNIGFPEDQLSILDRFDLHYAIPKLKKRINQILFRRNFKPINNIESKERIYNYLFEAKRLYSEGIIISQELINVIEKLNNLFFQEKKPDKIITPREPIIITKIVKGISALRFKKEVDDSDIEYLKKHLINTIIPFQENDLLFKVRIFDMNEIFRKTFVLLSELNKEIPISEHIDFIRDFLESHYFPYHDLVIRDPAITNKINEYMPSETGLYNNRKYRTLLENKENVRYIESIGYVIGKKDNKTYFIKKNYLNEFILRKKMKIDEENAIIKRIEEIFEANKFKALEEKSIRQTLKLEFREELIEKAFDYLWDNGVINSDENNDKLIYFKKEVLLNLKIEKELRD